MEPRRGRSNRRSRDQCIARKTAPQFLNHAFYFTRGADAARWRRIRPDPERQQQRLLPGQRAKLVSLGEMGRKPKGALPVYPEADAASAPASGFSPPETFPRPAHPRERDPDRVGAL